MSLYLRVLATLFAHLEGELLQTSLAPSLIALQHLVSTTAQASPNMAILSGESITLQYSQHDTVKTVMEHAPAQFWTVKRCYRMPTGRTKVQRSWSDEVQGSPHNDEGGEPVWWLCRRTCHRGHERHVHACCVLETFGCAGRLHVVKVLS